MLIFLLQNLVLQCFYQKIACNKNVLGLNSCVKDLHCCFKNLNAKCGSLKFLLTLEDLGLPRTLSLLIKLFHRCLGKSPQWVYTDCVSLLCITTAELSRVGCASYQSSLGCSHLLDLQSLNCCDHQKDKPKEELGVVFFL